MLSLSRLSLAYPSRQSVASVPFCLSLSLSLTNSLTLHKQAARACTVECVGARTSCASVCVSACVLTHIRVYVRTYMVHLFFADFAEHYTHGGHSFLLSLLPVSLPFLISRSRTLVREIRTLKPRSIILQERSAAQWRRQLDELEEFLWSLRKFRAERSISRFFIGIRQRNLTSSPNLSYKIGKIAAPMNQFKLQRALREIHRIDFISGGGLTLPFFPL